MSERVKGMFKFSRSQYIYICEVKFTGLGEIFNLYYVWQLNGVYKSSIVSLMSSHVVKVSGA